MTAPGLGLGLGWRPQLAPVALHQPDLGFVEILADAFCPDHPLPLPLAEARRRGITVVPHGVGLGLGGADVPDRRRLRHLARLAEQVGAPLVSEHVAFVRAGGVEAGHLLPVARSRAALEVLVENVRIAVEALPVPLALEPIAALVEWPEPELDEAELLTELLDRTGALLLLDVANLYANATNHGFDPVALLDRLPLDRLAYVHVAGGARSAGMYHDTHADPVPTGVLELLVALDERAGVPGALLERDDRFPTAAAIDAELDAIRGALSGRGRPWPALPAGRIDEGRLGDAVPPSTRRALDDDQRRLLTALLGQGPLPPGFDAIHATAAGVALRAKRAKGQRRAEQPLTAIRCDRTASTDRKPVVFASD